jgi:hypothetical protein
MGPREGIAASTVSGFVDIYYSSCHEPLCNHAAFRRLPLYQAWASKSVNSFPYLKSPRSPHLSQLVPAYYYPLPHYVGRRLKDILSFNYPSLERIY